LPSRTAPEPFLSRAGPTSCQRAPRRLLKHGVLDLEDLTFKVFVILVEDLEMPAPLVGQSIHGPHAGDEGGKRHETCHDRWEHPQLFFHPFKEAEARVLAGRLEVSGPRTQLLVRVHELRMCSLDLRARHGLSLVHTVAQGVEPRLQLLGKLAGETALRPCHLGLGLRSLRISDGLVRLPPLIRQLALEFHLLGLHGSHLLRQPADFAFRSRLLPHSIRMLHPETLDLGSKVRSQGTRRDVVGEVGRLPQTHEARTLTKTTTIKVQHTYTLQLLRQLLQRLPQLLSHGARYVLSGSGRQNLAAHIESGPRVPRCTLRPSHHRRRGGYHRRRDNNQLPPIRPYTTILVKDLVFKNKNLPTK
jgi:hypothetical protein